MPMKKMSVYELDNQAALIKDINTASNVSTMAYNHFVPKEENLSVQNTGFLPVTQQTRDKVIGYMVYMNLFDRNSNSSLFIPVSRELWRRLRNYNSAKAAKEQKNSYTEAMRREHGLDL